MKSWLSLGFILFFGGFLVFSTFFLFPKDLSRQDWKEIFFSHGVFVDKEGEWKFTSVSEQSVWSEGIVMKKLDINEKIYSLASHSASIRVLESENGGRTEVFLGQGVFLVSHGDPLRSYRFSLLNKEGQRQFFLSPISSGVFLIQNIPGKEKIFSYNGVAQVEMFLGKDMLTDFSLFPGVFFAFNQAFLKDMKKADIVRISMLNTLQYLDSGTADLAKTFGNPDINMLTKSAFADIKEQKRLFLALLKSLKEIPAKEIEGSEVFQDYQIFLVNESKKGYYLQQKLLSSILDWYRAYDADTISDIELKKSLSAINQTLEEAKNSNQEQQKELLGLLKRSASLIFLANSSKNNASAYKQSLSFFKANYGADIEKSSIFYRLAGSYEKYVFEQAKKQDLNDGIYRTLVELALPKQMSYVAPSFTFFLAQYIERDATPTESLFGIVKEMFIRTSAYSKTLDKDEKGYITLATNYYYNTSILNQLYDSILKTYFVDAPEGKILDPEKYVQPSGDISLPEFVVDGVAAFSSGSSSEFKYNERMFASLKRAFAPKDQRDDFALYAKAFAKMGELSAIFADYKGYLRKLALDPESQRIQELWDSEVSNLTASYPAEFLSQFYNVDMSSLRVLNNFKKDEYFRIHVIIFWATFEFSLRPQGNVIFDIDIVRSDGTKDDKFKATSFSVDKRKLALEELQKGADTDELRYWYDYKNMFENVFLVDPAIIKQREATETALRQNPDHLQKMSAEMQAFVEEKLIQGDFSRIRAEFPIGFKNIYAEISSGKYQIQLIDIPQSVRTKSTLEGRCFVSVSGEYDYPTHSFVNMRLVYSASQDALGGQEVLISPGKIGILDFKKHWLEIEKYFDVLSNSSLWSQIVFDFAKKVVIVDGVATAIQ